ncbi:MAG: transcriptional repressor [Hyphomicrobiaceae bacterium]|nr:transcriptional repressor [Hyphomicrobiaceae bacterium]
MSDMSKASAKETPLEALCAQKGLRMTGQRRIIAQVLSKSDDHPDVEEVYKRSSAVDPHISLSTVYRTVRLFEEEGILERHEFRDGRARYERVDKQHHDHLIDMKSGEVIEFRNEKIEQLQIEIAAELGFKLIDHRLELYGVPIKKDEA